MQTFSHLTRLPLLHSSIFQDFRTFTKTPLPFLETTVLSPPFSSLGIAYIKPWGSFLNSVARKANRKLALSVLARSYTNYNFPPDHVSDATSKRIARAVEAEQAVLLNSMASQIANETEHYQRIRTEITNQNFTLDRLKGILTRNEKQFYPYYPALKRLEKPFSIPSFKTRQESFVRKFVGNIETAPVYSGSNRSVVGFCWLIARYPSENATFAVSVVSLLTVDRLFLVPHMLNRWPGFSLLFSIL